MEPEAVSTAPGPFQWTTLAARRFGGTKGGICDGRHCGGARRDRPGPRGGVGCGRSQRPVRRRRPRRGVLASFDAGGLWLIHPDPGGAGRRVCDRGTPDRPDLEPAHAGRPLRPAGSGVGRALVRAAEQAVRQRGGRLLLVDGSGVASFAAQRAFYWQLGYTQRGRVRDYYATGDDKVTFSKDLHAAPPRERGVRTATSDDLGRLLELAQAFYAEDGFTTPSAVLAGHLQHLVADVDSHLTVVEVDGAPVGFAATSVVFGLEQGWTAELQDLYVATGHRNRGLAASLIEDSAAWATGRDAQALNVVFAPGAAASNTCSATTPPGGFADGRRRLHRSLH